MKYDFITVLDRTGADSIAANIDPWGVSPAPAQRIPMWVADMSFPTAPPILEAMHKRLAFPNFGYFSMPDEYFDCILRWQETRNGLTGLKRADIGYENGVPTFVFPPNPAPSTRRLFAAIMSSRFFSSFLFAFAIKSSVSIANPHKNCPCFLCTPR